MSGKLSRTVLKTNTSGDWRVEFNPFRPPPPIVPCVLEWHEGTVTHLAKAAYEERTLPEGTLDLHRLAVLADALEEAGCKHHDILRHLRQQGAVHVRGCWVVDLLTGRE